MTNHTREYGGEEEALRLVKLRLPARLVRLMDRTISRSQGAYLDRNEFVVEALWDRINEEGVAQPEPSSDPEMRSQPLRVLDREPKPSLVEPQTWRWGSWRDTTVATMPSS